LSTEAEIDLVTEGLIHYLVNLWNKKFVEQFVTPKLYNKVKLEFVAVKGTPMGHIQLPSM
jgi:hypothetical protein